MTERHVTLSKLYCRFIDQLMLAYCWLCPSQVSASFFLCLLGLEMVALWMAVCFMQASTLVCCCWHL